ncbi:GNAT family N-acetyltransferase [Streptomyces sp. NPDC007063]|uniref:GNAT family N-acetyltransferase n=1 Tax=Streptomyces sp. NPDC007063 TaxID=3364772 RepID=UPI003681DD17
MTARADWAVLEVPQWQGSGSVSARRLVQGARATADMFPAARRTRVPVDVRAAATGPVDGVRALDALAANLSAVRFALEQLPDRTVVTTGGDCGVELAPVERAHRRYGDKLALVWFDAHGDLHTPDTSPSGAFHGMVLRTLLGDGPAELGTGVPLAPGQVVLAGVRSLDPAERRYVDRHAVHHLPPAELADPSALVGAVARTGAEAVYVHLDLDVLDPGHFSSVGVPEPDGLSPHRLASAVRALARNFTLAGLGVTEHQPPGEGRTADAAVLDQLARTLTDTFAGSPPEEVRRIERHALAAWPAPVARTAGGWLLRHTPGVRRLRSDNTALPLSPPATEPAGDPAAALSMVEDFYAGRGLPAAVQVGPGAEHLALDASLAARGYRLRSRVHVLTASARTVADGPAPLAGRRTRLSTAPTAEWLRAFVELDAQQDSRQVADQVIAGIAAPLACVAVFPDDAGSDTGTPAGIGLFVGGDDDWAGVYCVITHPAHRRRKVAATVLRAGAAWAASEGVRGLYLQVGRANTPAQALYTGLGFRYAYSYHYRLREESPGDPAPRR